MTTGVDSVDLLTPNLFSAHTLKVYSIYLVRWVTLMVVLCTLEFTTCQEAEPDSRFSTM